MDSKKPLYKSIPFLVVVLLLLYSALGFFAIPYIGEKKAKEYISQNLNSDLTFKNLHFNPFTFSSSITEVKLTDKDATLWFSADEIQLDIALWKTVFNNISIQELLISKPFYKIVTQTKNNSISVKYPQVLTSKENQSKQEQFKIDIDEISLSKGSIQYKDESGKKQFNLNLKELSFNQQLFSTKDSNSYFDLSVKTDNEDEAHLSGNFNFAQLKLDAKWKIKNWTTAMVFNFIADKNNRFLGLKNLAGLINAHGQVLYQGLKDEKLQISINQLKLIDFKNNDENKQQFNISQVALKDANIDLIKQLITLEEITTNGALVELTIDEQYRLLGSEISVSQEKNANSVPIKKKWDFNINQFRSINSIVVVNKKFKDSSLNNTINLKNISINNITSDPTKLISVKAEMIIDETGKLNIQSELISKPLNVQTNLTAEHIDLSRLSAWIPSQVKLSINNGSLSFKQQLQYNQSISSKGSIDVNQLELVDDNKLPFLQLEQLNIDQFSLNSSTKSIKLNAIKLDKIQGSIMISQDKKLNLSELIDNQNEPDIKVNTQENDWIIEIQQVELIDGKTSFIDKSIKPEYHTELSKLNGQIKGLSSSNLSKAKVKLSGVIDSYGKITVNGKINPLSDKAYTDLSIDINNLDLQNFNSYSSRYLGFPINRGKADFNLQYKLNQSLLKGVNNLTFKQLKFGQKTASKDAVDLPLKLAVTLLTDGKGIMKINMPVSGNIDDPEFSYGGLVFKAFFKLITGIVASPFKLLGKLIPDAADLDLSGVQFLPGSPLLLIGEEEKLKAMQKILTKKPNLNLELTAIIHTDNDSKALRVKKLLDQVGFESIPDMTNKLQLTKIKKLYEAHNFTKTWQQLSDESTQKGFVNNSILADKAWKKLLSTQNIITELSTLAKQRTLFVQSQLIENYSISQDRIFLIQSQNSQELHPQVKFGIAQ